MPSEALECAWQTLQSLDSRSLLKRNLTPETYKRLRDSRTASGATLLDLIRSGVKNPDSGVGVYAPDADSYHVFSLLLDPIIAHYHLSNLIGQRQPPVDFGNPNDFRDLDPSGKYILSTRIRCARSFEGFPFGPMLTRRQYLDMEAKVRRVVKGFRGDLAGDYFPLASMTERDRQQLIADHFLFKNGDRFMEAANATRFWPVGRGIFHNKEKTFLIWVNEEDHLRIISMQKGADLRAVYQRFVTALRQIESSGKLTFARDENLGYLTCCPTNIGTTIRASVHIKFPRLKEEMMRQIAQTYNLDVRGTNGEHSKGEQGVFDISNKRRLGMTEYQAVKDLQDGILSLITADTRLANFPGHHRLKSGSFMRFSESV